MRSGIASQGVVLQIDAAGPGASVVQAAQLPDNAFVVREVVMPSRPDLGPIFTYRPASGFDLSLVLLPESLDGTTVTPVGWFEDGTPLVSIGLDVDSLRGLNGLPNGGATSFSSGSINFHWCFVPMPRGVHHLTAGVMHPWRSTPGDLAAAFPAGVSVDGSSRRAAEAILTFADTASYLPSPVSDADVEASRVYAARRVDRHAAINAALPALDAIADGRWAFVKAELASKGRNLSVRIAPDGVPTAEQRVRAAWLAAAVHRRADTDARAVRLLAADPLAAGWAVQTFHHTDYLPDGSVGPLINHLVEAGALGGDADPRRNPSRPPVYVDHDLADRLLSTGEPRDRSVELARRLLEASTENELAGQMSMSFGGYLLSTYPLPEELVVAVNALEPVSLRRRIATALMTQDEDLHLEGDRLVATLPRDVYRRRELESLRARRRK